VKSKIEWTDATWNPVTGCTPASDGCRNCYAERMAIRLQGMGQRKYRNGFYVTCHHGELLERAKITAKPCRVFVCSMGDLFHDQVPFEFVELVFATMERYPKHTFQLLTKRPGRMAKYAARSYSVWPANVWAGVTVESLEYRDRIELLKDVPAPVRFLSCEPLLGPLKYLDLSGIQWVIAGCESGPGRRPMKPDWVRTLRDQARSAGIPFFLKQTEGPDGKIEKLPLLDGVRHCAFP
jgi:protein gp37